MRPHYSPLTIIIIAILVHTTLHQCLTHYDYFDFVNGGCKPCGVNCLTCFDAVVCTQCVPQFYMNGNTCQKCSFGCSICTSASSCTTCNDGLYLTSSGTCLPCSNGVATCTIATVQTCQDGYFLLGQICAGCFTNCKTCSDFVTCTTCSLSYYLGSGGTSCLSCPANCRICTSATSCSQCDIGYTQSIGGCTAFTCSSINPFCVSCANGQCLSCQPGKYLQAGTCVQGSSLLCLEADGPYYTDCVTSSYGCQSYSSIQTQNNNQMSVCLPLFASKTNQYIYSTPTYSCSGTCTTTNTISMTQSTSQTYYQLTFHLKIRFYSNTATRSVVSNLISSNGSTLATTTVAVDISQELSTFGSTDSGCLNCIYGQKIISGTIVYSAGQYPTNLTFTDSAGMIQVVESLIDHSICQVDHCNSCSSAVDCLSCLSPYYLQLSTCVTSCDSGFYLFNNTCYLTCPSGTYTLTSAYTCQLCVSPCLTCTTTSSCLTCVSGYYLQGTSCLSSCSSTTLFANSTSNVCQSCPNPCVTCQLVNSTVKCLSCSSGYLYTDGSCVFVCPSGEYGNYINGTSQCITCSSACSSCYISSSICTSCSSGFLLLDTTCNSITSCPSSYYIDTTLNRCLSCHYPCKTCQLAQDNCTACVRGILHGNSCLNQCPITFYADYSNSSNATCQACQPNCVNCQSVSICISCMPNFYLYNGGCSSTCPSSFFPDSSNNSCTACIPPCKTCLTNTSCLSCTSGYLDNNTCSLQCNSTSYVSSTFQCTLCVSPCATCHSSSACQSCVLPFLYFNQTCITETVCLNKSGYYPQYTPNATSATSAQCSSCTFPCQGCLNTSVSCTSCVSGYFFVSQTSKCLSQCPDSYYASGSNCLNCDSNCYLCSITSTNCTSCTAGMYLNPSTNSCLTTCPTTFYGDDQTQKCSSCNAPCATCYNLYLCITCQTGILYNKQCVSSCPASTFLNSTDNSCVSCTNSCLTCSGTSSTCLSCSNGYFFYNNTCPTSCPSLYYGNQFSNLCQACSSPCANCSSSSSCLSCVSSYYLYNNQCLTSCASSYYADNATNTCLSCDMTICLTCSQSATNCLTCNSNYFMHNSSCVSTCPNGYYANSVKATCDTCPFPCATCTNYTFCTTCLTSYYLFSNRCFSSCPISNYPDNSSLCQSCSTNCQSCTSLTTCIQCKATYYLLNSACTQNCPLGQFPGTQAITNYDECQSCQTDCVNCTAYDYCVQCVSGLIQFNGLCLSSCPIFYYPATNITCGQCSTYCASCVNNSHCTSCIGSYLHNNQCTAQCPAGTYPQSGTSCQACTSPCANCTGDFTCTTCITGYIYFHSYCISACPSDVWYYPSNNTCNSNCPYNKHQATMTCYVSGCGNKMVAFNGNCLEECSIDYYVNQAQQCTSCSSSNSLCGSSLFKGDLQILYIEQLTLVLYFNQQAQLANINDITIQMVDIEGNQLSHSVTSYQITPYMMTFKFDRSSINLVNITLTIPYLQSQQSPQKISTNIYKKELDTYRDYSSHLVTTALQGIPIFFCAILVCLIIINIINKASRFVQILDFAQLIAVTLYLDIQYPPVLQNYLAGFRIVLFAIGKNIINIVPYTFSPPKFIFYHTDTNLFRNQMLLFLIFIGIFITFIVLICVNTYNHQNCASAVRVIRYRWLNDLFAICMTPLFLFCCQFNNQNPGILFIGILVLALGICYVGWISYKIMGVKKLSQLSGLLGQFQRTQSKIGLMYIPFAFLRRIIFTLGLGVAPYNPIATITLLLVLTFLIMVCIYFYQPFDNQYTDYITIFMESALTLYIICLIILGLNVMQANHSHNMGAFCVALISLTIAICLGWLIYLTISDIRIKGWCPKQKDTTGEKDDYAQKKYDQDEDQIRKMQGLQPLSLPKKNEQQKESANQLIDRYSDQMFSNKNENLEQFRHWSDNSSNSQGMNIRQSKLPQMMIKVDRNQEPQT